MYAEARYRVWDPGGDKAPWSQARTLIDTGANVNCMSLAKAMAMGLRIRKTQKVIKMGKGKCNATGAVDCAVYVGDHCFKARFIVIDGLNQEAIIGMPTLRNEHAIIDCAAAALVFKYQLYSLESVTDHDDDCDDDDANEFIVRDETGEVIEEVEVFSVIVKPPDASTKTDLPETLDPRMEKIYRAYKDTVFAPLSELPPRRGKWDFRIELLTKTDPTKISHYRMSAREKQAIWDELVRLQKLGWFVASGSQWSSPVLFARNVRKDGSLRAVYDYRALNAHTRRNAYPVPRIDDLVEKLSGASRYTVVDLRKAFNQIRNARDSRQFTAISTPFGLFESEVMMLGLKNSGPHFQSFIDAVLRGDATALPRFANDHPRFREGERRVMEYTEQDGRPAQRTFEDLTHMCAVYIDDIVIFSDTAEQHEEDVRTVFERLHHFHLRANEFCTIGSTDIDFVGYRISKGTIAPLPEKVRAIAEWAVPKTVTDVRSFLGVIQYYRASIPSLANFGAVLSALTAKGVAWQWGDKEQFAFEEIKKRLTNAVARSLPDLTQPFVVCTDASIYGLGGVLLQVQNGQLKPIEFYSRQTTSVEGGRNGSAGYSQYELELLGIVECVKHWRHFLDGARTVLYTDHHTLVTGGILRKHSTHHFNPRVLRWIEYLMPFDIDLRHHAATRPLAQVADACSRRPDYYPKKELASVAGDIAHECVGHVHIVNMLDGDLHAIQDTIHNGLENIRNVFKLKNKAQLEEQYDEHDGLWYKQGKLFIPEELPDLRLKIIDAVHQVGHKGMNATEKLVRARFYWPNMQRDVRTVIKNCAICERTKPRNFTKRAPILPLAIPEQRWEKIEIDFIVGLPASGPQGYTSIATIIDRLTKLTVLIPTWETVTAQEFASQFIMQVWRRFGLPAHILTDRDPKFMSKFWEELLSKLKIAKDTGAPYHHQTTGQVEAANKNIEITLRSMINRDQKNWAEMLPIAEFAINAAPIAATGLSPFHATLGYQPRVGIAPEWWPQSTTGDTLGFFKRMDAIIDHVRRGMAHAQQRMREREPGREPPQYKIGDRVYLSAEHITQKDAGPSLKLQDPWIGPFDITGFINPRTVTLHLPSSCHIDNKINVDRIKLAHSSEQPMPDIVLADDGTHEAYYEIEKLVDHETRGRGNKKVLSRVRVRWQGWSPEYDTWHYIADIPTALVAAYAKEHGLLLSPPPTTKTTNRPRTRSRAVNMICAPDLTDRFARGRIQLVGDGDVLATGIIGTARTAQDIRGKRVFAQPTNCMNCMNIIESAVRMDPMTHAYVVAPEGTKFGSIFTMKRLGTAAERRNQNGKWISASSPFILIETSSP